jgi:hypothetical protein
MRAGPSADTIRTLATMAEGDHGERRRVIVPPVTAMTDDELEAMADAFVEVMRRRANDPAGTERGRQTARDALEAAIREREARDPE